MNLRCFNPHLPPVNDWPDKTDYVSNLKNATKLPGVFGKHTRTLDQTEWTYLAIKTKSDTFFLYQKGYSLKQQIICTITE